MNRNVESHFALNPTSLDIARSQFDRSSGVKFSANVGELIPFYVDEVLPGDTFKVTTSKVVRLQTLVHPIMDNMYLDCYYFFVPNRIVWDHWKYFCGESAAAWTPQVEYRVPKINTSIFNPHPGEGSLMDYMGIPLGVLTSTDAGANPKGGINALPFRAYAKICNDWFRSEVVTDELVIPTGDSDVNANAKSASDLYCAYGGPVFKAAKYHDYFTSCLPSPQSGPTVNIPGGPLNLKGPIFTSNDPSFSILDNPLLKVKKSGGSYVQALNVESDNSVSYGAATDSSLAPVNLIIDTSKYYDSSGVLKTGFKNDINLGTINELRIAFQVQKFYEKMSRGRRYIEVLKSQFGVTSPDARLQRPEYLGGNRIPLNISEVTNNSKGESGFLGDLGAMSRTVDSHEDFVHSFTEHGFLIGLCVVRYDHSYPQGLERFWSRTTMFDYYWPVFANLGEQKVYKKEINFQVDPDGYAENEIFGYQEYAADYRYKPSRVAGEMRPESSNSLASWHLADYYSQAIDPNDPTKYEPYLSDSWMREDKTNVDRTLAVTSAVSNQYFADFYVQNICTRVMPMYSIPGLADHH